MAGLPVFFGSPVSSYAERRMNLLGLGKLLAMSNQSGINELACVKFRYEFGRDSVFTVRQPSESSHEKYEVSGGWAGRVLFGGERSMDDLMELFHGDVDTGTTEITDSFTYADYREKHPERIILFVTTDDGHIRFPVGDEIDDIASGDRITALIRPAQAK